MTYLSFADLRLKLGGRSRSSIYRDLMFNRLPLPLKIGHRLYWNEAEVDAAISAQRMTLRARRRSPG